ncbi:hypothetical protein [Polaribacter sp.]|uniref:hypothetical protein n=1 Tax=Polaribacter sp. TaxID=1920175 RepID=UPI004048B13E
MKKINFLLAIILIIVNIYFIPLTIINIKNSGGAMGFGLLLAPFTIFINLFVIPAFIVLKEKYRENKFLFVVNLIGTIFSISLFWLLISTPILD